MSPEGQALAVLKCPRCGAAAAVSDEPRTACAYCHAEVEVPEAYRTALLVAAREVQADELTRRAFDTLGKPPSVALRVIDFFTTAGAPVLATVFLTVVGTVHVANWLLDRCTPWFHVNAWDWFANAEQNLLVWGTTFAVLLTLFALGAFGRRHVSSLRGLQRALAARPAARPGGPAQCRQCGAPLTVPSDALGVRCAYCRSDNLLSLPKKWLDRKRGAVASVEREAKAALLDYRAECRRLYLRLAIRLSLIGGLAALVLTSTVREVFAGGGGNFDLRAALRAPRELFDIRAGAALLGTPSDPSATVPVNQCRSQYVLHRDGDLHCFADRCSAGWFVALRAGERLEIVPSARGNAHFVAHYKDRGWTASYGRADYWGEEIASAVLTPERPARFRAPNTSWYRLEVRLQDLTEDVSICAKIE
ncbi:MAG: hypothetical protein ABUL62_04940 [Myxococcales bacterium]